MIAVMYRASTDEIKLCVTYETQRTLSWDPDSSYVVWVSVESAMELGEWEFIGEL